MARSESVSSPASGTPATCAFHQGELSLQGKHVPNRFGQRQDSQFDTRLTCGQMRSDCRLESERIDLLIAQRQRALPEQRQRIAVAQAFGRDSATGCHRLRRRRAEPGQPRGMQKPGSDGGLADFGVCAGDEISCVHFISLRNTPYTT